MIEEPFSLATLANRPANKAFLQREFGLDPDPGALLLGVVSRLSWQKGQDLLIANLDVLDRIGAQLAILGAGEPALEQAFLDAAARAAGTHRRAHRL